jgi:1,5-anhydro-D-fructose reductase (1,5-anhydro-D-mannitol-forming)
LMPGFGLARNSTVSALYRRNILDARVSAAQYEIGHAFDSAAELCRCPDVDAVLVSTPNCFHLEHVLLAIKAGKPILCEKPMGMNGRECRKMVESAASTKILLGVAHVFRFNRSIEKMRERIRAGQVGRPIFVRSEFSFLARNHARKWLTDSRIAGGGPIADVGVHCIDALRWTLDDEIVKVAAISTSDQESKDVESAAVLSVEFAHGTLGSVQVSTRAPYRTPLEIIGETGWLRGIDAFSVETPVELELQRAGHGIERESVSNADAYARQVDAFSAAVEGKMLFPASGEDGWQNQEVLDAAYRSLRTGKLESVPMVKGD